MRHLIIYIPGLGDRKTYAFAQKAALQLWRSRTVHTHYFTVGWADKHETYAQKQKRLVQLIDAKNGQGYTVSLVAASAGSNLALAAFAARTRSVHRVVSICGKIKYAETVNAALFALNPSFKTALGVSGKVLATLPSAARQKILTVRASRDSYVPARDGEVTGAHIHILHTMGHVFSIFLAITLFRRISLRFITAT